MGQQSQLYQSPSYTDLIQNISTACGHLDLSNIIGLSPSDFHKKGGLPADNITTTNNNNDTQLDCKIYLVLQYINFCNSLDINFVKC